MDRRLRPASQAFAVAFVALVLASLLNAHGLRKTAEIQPQGFRRDVAIALTKRLVSVSEFLHLDRPRQELKAAIGRGSDDRIDTRVVLPQLPPPRVAVRPRPRPLAKPRVVVTPHRAKKPVVVKRPAPPPPSPPPKLAFSPSHPLRIWVAGDSLVAVPGQSLERATASGAIDVVAVESRVATGLGRPDVFNWYTRFEQAIGQYHPQVAVLSFGSNDDHDYMTGLPPGHTIGPIGSTSWVAEYRRRVDGITREFNASGAYVVWLGLPITRGEGWNKPFRVINRILDAVAKAHAKTSSYVDAWDMFKDPHGRYADYLRNAQGQLVQMRVGDGVHYMPPAGDLLARTVLHRLNQLYDLTSWKQKRRA